MELVNRVAKSGLETINLEDLYPKQEFAAFDLKDYLFKELILKEKDFRLALKEHNWEQYRDKVLLVYCSNDAIIPVWAYMLVASKATPFAVDIFQGDKTAYLSTFYKKVIEETDWSAYEGAKIVIKGCSDKPVPPEAYLALTLKLTSRASSLMYGEPCSTVPIHKQPKR